MIRILMTGAGSPGAAGIIKSLQRSSKIKLFVADMDPCASGRFLHKDFFHIPAAGAPNFISQLTSVCVENQIDIIFPLVTNELLILSENRKLFETFGTKIIVSEPGALNKVNDKGELYNLLRDSNLPCPEYYISDNVTDLIFHVNTFLEKNKQCVIKPCLGNGSRGVRIITNEVNRYDLLFKEKPNSLYMSPEDLVATLDRKSIPKMIISEHLSGEEVTVDTLIKNGKVQLLLIRRRTKMTGGISVNGNFIENKQIEKSINDICSKVIGLSGPIGFQLKQNSAGFFHFIECNPRIQGTSVAAMGLGIDLPLMAVNLEIGESIAKQYRRSGVGFCRYFEEIFYDL